MRIDYHTHFMQRAHFGPDFMKEWDARGGTGAWPEVSIEDFESAVKDFDRVIVFGITALALGVHTPHDYVAKLCERNRRKYIGFMALDPSSPDAIDQMERGVRDFGMKGIKLYPVMSLYNPPDPALHPFFKRASDLKLPILTHTGTSPASKGILRYSLPLQIDELAIAFPDLRIIMAHLGHPWQRDAAMVVRKHPNVYADISGIWHRPWQGYEAMIVCLEWGVTDKLLFGSDYPLWDPTNAIAGLRQLNRYAEGTNLPRIPEHVIDEILNRDILDKLQITAD
jgi:hypothetical protein